MTNDKTGTRKEWLAAHLELLKDEKELTRRSDELAKKIGKDRYRNFLEKSNYGNRDVSIDDPDFWNFGNFAISPINQINILKGV